MAPAARSRPSKRPLPRHRLEVRRRIILWRYYLAIYLGIAPVRETELVLCMALRQRLHLGRSGSGFYVEASYHEYALPLRKTYEWFQRDLAVRDFELLRAAVGAVTPTRRSA